MLTRKEARRVALQNAAYGESRDFSSSSGMILGERTFRFVKDGEAPKEITIRINTDSCPEAEAEGPSE